MTSDEFAVNIVNAYKYYGSKKGPNRMDVLNGISMKVQRGTVYGLLGPSGCGKSTLLNCIVGRMIPNSGDIWVLGGTPGSEQSGVPGPRIGYMPQDLAIIPEFTIKEISTFYGKMFRMDAELLEKSFKEIHQLLDLPDDSQKVAECSGGQQRRISLAVAMVHRPELLILDEPTTGLDPMLREKIWNYFVDITEKYGVTIIITTHYIEECRLVQKIGLMRQGKLIAEDKPANLLLQHNTESLEEVFLELSRKQEDIYIDRLNQQEQNHLETRSTSNERENKTTSKTKKRNMFLDLSINSVRLRIMFYKNILQISRNYTYLFFLLFPALQISLFYLTVGHDLPDLPVAFINKEGGHCTVFETSSIILNDTLDCGISNLACEFIEYTIGPNIKQVDYVDMNNAVNDLKTGKLAGIVNLHSNFTSAIRRKISDPRYLDNNTLSQSQIEVITDMSQRVEALTVRKKLQIAYLKLTESITKKCSISPKIYTPISYEKPVYGVMDDTFSNFVMPGFLVTTTYFTSLFMASLVLTEERTEGIWDRNLVAGVTLMEIILSHLLIQFFIIAIHICQELLLVFYVLEIHFEGSMFDITLLLTLQGLGGVIYGFLISAVSTSHTMSNTISSGNFFIIFLISGVLWPTESMPTFLRAMSSVLPFPHSVNALRFIFYRGWGLTNIIIFISYIINVLWILINSIATFIMFKRKG